MWVQTDDTGRVLATTDCEEFAAGMSEYEFPADFDYAVQDEWRIVDGTLVHDPLPTTTPDTGILRREQLEKAIPLVLGAVAPLLTDEQLESVSLLLPDWSESIAYATDDVVRHDDMTWRASEPNRDDAPCDESAVWCRLGGE